KRREECERKARRGEMDPRLEFTFQLLIDGTGLPRHSIMDHVFEGNMVREPATSEYNALGLDDINQLFLPHMRNKLLWYYQDVEEVEQKAPVEGVKPRQQGQGKQPPPQVTLKRKLFLSDGWDVKFTGVCIYMFRINVSKQLPEEGFCGILNAEKVGLVTAIERVMEHVYMSALAHPSADGDEDETRFPIVKNQLLPGLRSFCNHGQLKEMTKNPTTITVLEERVNEWIKKVMEDNEVQLTLTCLQLANSKVIKLWRDTDHKITFCYNEAKDNAKFIQAMEKCCHSLYLDDPVKIKDSILSLLQTITNQMIETCKQYITCRFKETIWSQDRALVRDKLIHCLNLNKTYRETYLFVKNQPFLPNTEQFSFSENYVFGKFDTFCKRVNKIISMFDLMEDYNHLFAKRMEGLLLGEEAKKAVTSCQYDYLDYRNNDFDKDYQAFEEKTNGLRESIGNTIEENFASVWETPQGIKFLTRFEKLWDVDDCLNNTLLKIDDTGRISVNLDHTIKLLIRESDCLVKMDVELPIFLLEDYLRTVRRVKLEVRPLFLPQVVRLSSLLLPGLRSVTWTSEDWEEFIDRANAAIKSFDVLVTRVHDIYTNRIIYVLSGMQEVSLISLPEETPWSMEEFIEHVETGCRNGCVELNRKSLMVEEAVEEASTLNESTSSGQQDWSAVWECFESPHRLLSMPAGGLSKSMQSKPIFLLQATLMIPNVSVKPSLEEIQEVLVLAGKHIAGLSKGELNNLVKRWRPYHYLWKCEKTLRQLLTWNLNDFELALKRHSELEAKLATEPDILKYKREMDYVYAIMNDLERKLERPIRDLDDVRSVMETLKKIREQEVDMELKIDPVEEAFNVITRYELPVSPSDLEQVDSLRYSWQQLQATALGAHVQLLKMQPQFEDDLKNNLDRFREDNGEYVHEYRHAGPMQSGLTPREASDRLILFQNRFDGMWRKLQTYQNGEELFGLPHTEYPELAQIRKELNLLQKLYKLLKEWPAFFALKKTIDDFNDMCPLLELMANKAMKPRHWQRIMEVTKYIFELDSEDFCLKNILEAPLLPNKEDIENTNEILERWLLVQNMWVYLEAVFVGGDIAKQLPKEAKRFSKIDKSWQKIMQRAHETPGVVSCCVGDDLLRQLLPHLQEQLELCQKSLSGYLEKKRTMFPRFFFVSDPALLEILGQASDSHTIQNHLLSIFDNTRYVKFHDIEYNKMIAIVSSEGEEIKLERPVRAEGSVETWLTSLLQSAQSSLHSIIRTSVGLLGIQIIWTRDAELALMQARQDKKIMMETNNKFLELLNTLIDQTTRDLLKIERIKFETLITIHVHQRDIFDMLCRLNVRSANDFEWLKQCRFYFKEDIDKTWISVTDVTFIYQNEYLGCTERLVITPLTDRGLGRIYKGLAQSGSWGCFDEFNRIELPVLSVAAQQVAVVLAAKKEKKKTFVFTDGDTSEMCPEFGIFITMNPGYAGRKELPENLKIQFRTVAMMVPDRQIIIRVKLASCGFLENITLARKFYTLYKLCEEQLTKQVHYDFGLRNILSVLRTLGAVKRVNSKDNESTIVMRVLRDMNLSKLIDEDEPLFISLVADLFPNQALEKTTYPELEEAIKLYETQRVRHGIMTLGPPGAGKTTCIHTLMNALTETENPHKEMRMNPKAITAAQMFGRLDVATNDWTDGIFSALWRKTLKMKTGEHVWLVLDGPVDSIWIENLNSVLDDNKTLTLANGDRLTMSPTSKIIFEPENIDNASPATVSRNGMVYMSASGLDWNPVLRAWLKTRSERELEVFSSLFEQTFPNVYTWCTQNLVFSMRVLQSNIILQMLSLLEGLVPPQIEETEDPSASKSVNGDIDDEEEKEKGEEIILFTLEHLHKIYVFVLIWGFGSLLETNDREQFDAYLKQNFADILDLPRHPNNKPCNVFDFYVKHPGKWELWDDMLTNYQYPDTASPDYASILVPIVDNVRINYLIHCIAKQGKAVLLLGEQGSAKTVMMKAYMKNANPEQFMGRSFNFSSATSPYQFQKTIESYVEKRSGMTFGPPGGKKMLVFIDDINLPQINEWGDQITNEIVRQTMSMSGFYSLEKPGDFTTVIDIQFLGAMGQPGGGRNDIPSRLKRQFAIFNCPLPKNDSIDKIFKVIGEGHYNAKRGFTIEVRNLIKKVIPLTRELWMRTRLNLLPTPAKFHYVFSLRDLSRVWQGMVGTLPTVIESEKCLMLLWKHECSRVFSDRFTIQVDKDWFNKALYDLAEEVLGLEYKKMMDCEPVFVDFMRDAPEPTGEEGEDADMELPKVYEPVFEYSELRERLEMFLAQFNEMVRGSGMDLVFFPDAMFHLVKISRVIRHPRGNVMLVGVGGSGKQSLTKLSTFIAGYRSFQIALTRSYNVGNFLEDLKLLYRSCGVQGKGTTFIFTDLDIKEEGFLEYLNNILSSGVISNLFSKDEQQEIISELTPIMKRENQKRTLNNELVMEYFLNRTCQNLHVVLCFSPVSEAFRYRALRFPALISGCTIDWFQPWPKDALVSVADHFLAEFEIECTKEVKKELVTVLGTIQDVVSQVSAEYFQRYRRSSHVTPKSYLNFIGGYKTIYQMKQKELGDGALRMDTGLEKLREASISVEVLKKDLAVMEQDLALASEKAGRVLTEVTERAMQAEIVKNQVQIVKEKAEALVAYIAEEKEKAEIKLEAAKPALEEAEAALNTIKPAHIATVRKLGRPPHLIMRIMDCVLILFQRRLHPLIPDVAAPCPKPSWAESLKMMASTTFLLQLQNYPKDIINNEMVEHLVPYFEMEDYNMDTAKRVCGDVAGLLSWTKAMAFFHSVNKEVLPLKANLLMQEARLKVAMDDLASAERQLEEREMSLRKVKEQYESAVAEKQQLTDAANVCLRKMTAATALINGLGGEKIRWTQQSKDFKEQLGRLVGDVVLATGFLSYCGPYNQEFRNSLLDNWMGILRSKQIPVTENLNITNMLIESATISEWTLQGLPNDDLSVQNALIVTKSSSYPLLVDPQSQGKNWIKNKESTNELQITSLNHKYFRTHLEDSLSLGRPLLIEDVAVELDPVIDNVLEKTSLNQKVIVGDKECDVMPGFMLYITTKLPNPAYSPEISAKTSIIDFTVTMRGLEDQLLGRVILMEKSDLEEERVALFESVMKNQRSMKELESNLLCRLTSSVGSLVDDEALIQVLQVTKTTAEEVNEKLKVAEVTEKKIIKAREEFRAVAARGSILYFLIVEMSNVNLMYQNSLKQFLTIFDNSITKSTKSNVTEERINIILKYLTHEVWVFTLRSLYERHKALFTLMLAMKIDVHRQLISHDEFMAFVKGGASLDLNAVTPKPFRWILDITWLNLVEISKLKTFSDVLQKITSNEKEWRVWYEKAKPEEETIPSGYNDSLDVFRKLLLIRSWSPDRTLSQARKYIVDSLGPEYGEGSILNLEATWEESEPRTPLICILSIGSDPSGQIASLAKSKEIQIKAVSMGQGQEIVARKMISDSMNEGGWVLLQNIHLSLPFCVEAMDALIETEHIQESFRLWLTTEVHTEFPIGLLQMAIKFTNEPPQGIRASMKRTYQNITQDTLDYSSLSQWPPLLYAVAFLHTILQERRKFGPLGWNVPYEFNQADYAASVQFIQNHLDDIDPKKGISWPTICYMLGEVQYGGRVTDDFDKRLLTTFTNVWFCDVILRPGFEFYKGYKVPQTRNLSGYVDYINQLPLTDTPEVFGLHGNADITYQINSAKDILDTILSVQPKEGGSQGGETRESIVYRLAEDMLEKLPKQYVSFEVREALVKMGAFLPMNIFLRQEIDRIQRVIKSVQSTLCNLKLAIDGTIVMSQALRESLDAMYDARIPQNWLKVSWESATLGFWYTELLEREHQYREVTRSHKGWALDSVVLQNLITKLNREDVHEGPAEGVYVHGLFLEGASLDRKSGKLIESKPKVLYEQMPIIYIFAINTTAGKDPRLYECPIYRKPQRTDAKYVGSIDFETDSNPRHWALRGVALLCDIK
ncbi:hypothetical protein MSG28_001183, partial [Choristoneura fumiferana]